MIEHTRAKQYATSLLEEVVGDTATINKTLSYYIHRSASLDTLIELFMKDDIKQVPGGLLYYFAERGMYNNGMTANHTSLQQLKSAGALRYFTNRKLIKCIGEYDQILQTMEDNERGSYTILTEARKSAFKIFDLKIFKKINKSNADTIVSHLVTYDPVVVAEFSNWANLRNRNLHAILIPNLQGVQQKARELIALLKNEYHL
ncbi:MAG: hypothetical protein ABIO81_11590 [Ginsengibacter sp.]